jgi:hypothetical protein
LIAMIKPCLAKMIALKMCECFKNGNGIFRKMSKELGRRDGRVCQEYEWARTCVVEHVESCPSCRLRTGLRDISPDPNHRTTTRPLYVATA